MNSLLKWVSSDDFSPLCYYYHSQDSSSLYTWKKEGEKILVGLPGKKKEEVVVSPVRGSPDFIGVFLGEECLFTFSIPRNTSNIECSMENGLLSITFIQASSIPITFSK